FLFKKHKPNRKGGFTINATIQRQQEGNVSNTFSARTLLLPTTTQNQDKTHITNKYRAKLSAMHGTHTSRQSLTGGPVRPNRAYHLLNAPEYCTRATPRSSRDS